MVGTRLMCPRASLLRLHSRLSDPRDRYRLVPDTWVTLLAIWLVSLVHCELGQIDPKKATLQTIDNPFGTGLSPMSPVRSVIYVSGPDLCSMEPRVGLEPTTCGLRNRCSTN